MEDQISKLYKTGIDRECIKKFICQDHAFSRVTRGSKEFIKRYMGYIVTVDEAYCKCTDSGEYKKLIHVTCSLFRIV